MKHLYLLYLIFFVFAGVSAQTANKEITLLTKNKPELSLKATKKILFRGAIYLSRFEMMLERDGNKLSGSYFYINSGRKNELKVKGSISANGKFVLREFNKANHQTGEFRGVLSENSENYDLYLKGYWKNKRQKSRQFDASGQFIEFTNGWRIDTHAIRERNKPKGFEINAEYPEIISGNGTDVSKFNLTVKDLIVKPAAKFRKRNLAQTTEVLKHRLSTNNDLDANYHIKLADEDFISIQFSFSDFEDGMAHALYHVKNLNYDLKNRRKLKLAELFQPDAKYLETLSAYCLKELQSRPPVNDEKLAFDDWASGAGADAENFRDWNLTSKGLLITFGFEQIAPYPAGVNYVLVPYSKLKEIARPDGALEQIMKKKNL